MSFDRLDAGARSVSRETEAAVEGRLSELLRHDIASLTGLFKALGHEGRLMILCHLAGGEKTVTALEGLLGQRQAAVSQQLARLRLEGLVTTRRDGKAIHYALSCPKVRAILRLLTETDQPKIG